MSYQAGDSMSSTVTGGGESPVSGRESMSSELTRGAAAMMLRGSHSL